MTLMQVSAAGIDPFTVEGFEAFKMDRKAHEQSQGQTLDTTSHTNHSNHNNNHGDSSAYHYNTHSDRSGLHGDSHTDRSGYHSDTHSDTDPHSNTHSDAPSSHSNNHTDGTKHGNNHSDSRTHQNNHSNRNTHSNYHSNSGNYHTNLSTHRDNYLGGSHHNVYPHNNYVPHSNSGHSNSGAHANSGHSNSRGSHSNSGHSDSTGAHNNTGHTNYTPYGQSGHNNSYHSNNGHTNYVPYSQSGHSNTYHSNSGHRNYVPHSNTGHSNRPHANIGFDHQNYIPSVTHLYDVDDLSTPKVLRDTVSIGLYAYDKNDDGYGTQTAQATTVKYHMRIRKVSDIDGNESVSPWRVLLNNSTTDVYELDTIDPLGKGNTNLKAEEGYYEIEAWASNDSKTRYGVTKHYVGDKKTETVKIHQNETPEITVDNGNEFINFVFGLEGAVDAPDGLFDEYADLYVEATAGEQEGIFVSVNMEDFDGSTGSNTPNQWQKGSVYIQTSGGFKVSGTEVPIIWENGSEMIQSNGNQKEGYVFIHKSKYEGMTLENAKLAIELADYLDEAATIPAGANFKQTTISKADLTSLKFHIDFTAPEVISFNTTTEGTNEISTKMSIKDPTSSGNEAGIHDVPYNFKLSGKRLDGNFETIHGYNGFETGSDVDNVRIFDTLQPNREYKVDLQIRDKLENTYDSSVDGGLMNNLRYTHVMAPTDISIAGITNTTIEVDITTHADNYEDPDYRTFAVPTDGNGIPNFASSNVVKTNWSKNTTQTLTGLIREQEYVILVEYRNGDLASIYSAGTDAFPTPEELEKIYNDQNPDPVFTNRYPWLEDVTADLDTFSIANGTHFTNGDYSDGTIMTIEGEVFEEDLNDEVEIYYSVGISTFNDTLPTIGTKTTSTGEGWSGNPFTLGNQIDLANLPLNGVHAGLMNNGELIDGTHTVYLWAKDHRDGVSNSPATLTINIDNTAPVFDEEVNFTDRQQLSQIIKMPMLTDPTNIGLGYASGIHSTPYRITRNFVGTSTVLTDWINATEYTADNLQPNAPYTYTVEAKDNLGNIRDKTSIQRYTVAKGPSGVDINFVGATSFTLDITDHVDNYETATHRIIAVPVNGADEPQYTDPGVVVGNWESNTIDGLALESPYLILIETRNGDEYSEFTFDNSVTAQTPTEAELMAIRADNENTAIGSRIMDPVYTNRSPIITNVEFSEGIHDERYPLAVTVTVNEPDVDDSIEDIRIKVWYRIDNTENYDFIQISTPMIAEGYNYNQTAREQQYTGYVPIDDMVEVGENIIELQVGNEAGKMSEIVSGTFLATKKEVQRDWEIYLRGRD